MGISISIIDVAGGHGRVDLEKDELDMVEMKDEDEFEDDEDEDEDAEARIIARGAVGIFLTTRAPELACASVLPDLKRPYVVSYMLKRLI